MVQSAVILKKVCRLLRQRDGSLGAPTAEGHQLMTALTVETRYAKKSIPEDAGTVGKLLALAVTASVGNLTLLTQEKTEGLRMMIFNVCRVVSQIC